MAGAGPSVPMARRSSEYRALYGCDDTELLATETALLTFWLELPFPVIWLCEVVALWAELRAMAALLPPELPPGVALRAELRALATPLPPAAPPWTAHTALATALA